MDMSKEDDVITAALGVKTLVPCSDVLWIKFSFYSRELAAH